MDFNSSLACRLLSTVVCYIENGMQKQRKVRASFKDQKLKKQDTTE